MKEIIRTADSKGRVAFPGFANATLIIEKVDETEYRVRKAEVIPENELHFLEEDFPLRLSERDAAAVLQSLENPPAPNKTARRAAKRFMKEHGSGSSGGTDRPPRPTPRLGKGSILYMAPDFDAPLEEFKDYTE